MPALPFSSWAYPLPGGQLLERAQVRRAERSHGEERGIVQRADIERGAGVVHERHVILALSDTRECEHGLACADRLAVVVRLKTARKVDLIRGEERGVSCTGR